MRVFRVSFIAAASFLLFIAAVAEAQQTTTPIRELRAAVHDSSVQLSWDAAGDPGDLILFRSRERIDSTERLAGATRLAVISGSSAGFTDYPIPGVPAYYALVPVAAIASGSIALDGTHNITTVAVALPLGTRSHDARFFAPYSFRSSPLPYLQPWRDMFDGDGRPLSRALPEQQPQRLDPATAEAVERLMQSLPPPPSAVRPQTILPQDNVTPDKGVAFTLRSIVEGPFAVGRWAEAREQVENLLTLPLPPEVEARARFYLGQTLYFEGRYERALLEFLLAQRHYYAPSSDWIEAALRRARGSRG